MQLKSKGLTTDLLLGKHMSRISVFDDHIVVDTPDNPKFFWGNYLIFRDSPKLDLIPYYISCFEKHFKNNPNISHIAFTWDDTDCFVDNEFAAKFADLGFEIDTTTIMTAQDISPDTIKLNGIEVRKITSNLDWVKILRLQTSIQNNFDPNKIYKMLEKTSEQYRFLIESNNGEWFGAFQGDRLVGDLGIIFDDHVARFQSVETHPDFRQQGICKALVHTAIKYVRECKGNIVFVIEAETGGLAERIYQGFGFTKTENLAAACSYDHSNWKI